MRIESSILGTAKGRGKDTMDGSNLAPPVPGLFAALITLYGLYSGARFEPSRFDSLYVLCKKQYLWVLENLKSSENVSC